MMQIVWLKKILCDVIVKKTEMIVKKFTTYDSVNVVREMFR